MIHFEQNTFHLVEHGIRYIVNILHATSVLELLI